MLKLWCSFFPGSVFSFEQLVSQVFITGPFTCLEQRGIRLLVVSTVPSEARVLGGNLTSSQVPRTPLHDPVQ